mmetsp:Transcript_1987/g.3586  ORF Transcript_1987/g.3586 Transcript_1987/m.3586 type:complete len:201 (+) Transcript_1987:458-1060(+)
MDSKPHLLTRLGEHLHQILEWVLALGDGKAVTRNNNDGFAVHQKFDNFIHRGGLGLTFKLFGCASSGRFGSVSTEKHTHNVTIHGIAHDFGQGRSTASNEGTHCGQKRHVQHKSFRTKSPSRVTVEDCDNDGHIGSSNGSCHVPTQHTTGRQSSSQRRKSNARLGSAHDNGSRTKSGSAKTHINLITCRMLIRSRTHSTI